MSQRGTALVAELDFAPISLNRLCAEHWKSRNWRRTKERRAVQKALTGAVVPPPPWCVTFTRYSTRKLDSDNLAASFKAPRDEVSAFLGADDSTIAFEYEQEVRREPAVRRTLKSGRLSPAWRVWASVTVETVDPNARATAPEGTGVRCVSVDVAVARHAA